MYGGEKKRLRQQTAYMGHSANSMQDVKILWFVPRRFYPAIDTVYVCVCGYIFWSTETTLRFCIVYAKSKYYIFTLVYLQRCRIPAQTRQPIYIYSIHSSKLCLFLVTSPRKSSINLIRTIIPHNMEYVYLIYWQ